MELFGDFGRALRSPHIRNIERVVIFAPIITIFVPLTLRQVLSAFRAQVLFFLRIHRSILQSMESSIL